MVVKINMVYKNTTIFNEKNQKVIAEMQTKYETEKKEKEAEIYRLETIELAEKNKQIELQKEQLEKTITNEGEEFYADSIDREVIRNNPRKLIFEKAIISD